MSDNKKPRIVTAADRAARSLRMMGNTLRKSRNHSEETRTKIALSSKGKAHTEQHVNNRATAVISLGEKNGAAVGYHFRSADGVYYSGRNIAHFVREHSHLFSEFHMQPSSPKRRVLRAVTAMTRLNLGLTKSWYGWTKAIPPTPKKSS